MNRSLFLCLCILFLHSASWSIFVVGFIANPSRLTVPTGWSRSHAADVSQLHTFYLLLPQQNIDYLAALLDDVANPWHPNYQQYRTAAEVAAIVSPPLEVRNTILSWLADHSITSKKDQFYDHGDAFKITTSIHKINRLFNLTMSVYYHHQSNRTHIASYGHAFIPTHIIPHIEMILGIRDFPLPIEHHITTATRGMSDHKAKSSPMSRDLLQASIGYLAMVPENLASIYGFPDRTKSSRSSSPATTIGVIQFDNIVSTNGTIVENMNPTDIASQGTFAGISHIQSTPTIVGSNAASNPAQEASLDVQVAASNANTAQLWFWHETGSNWIYQFCLDLEGHSRPPQVVSISYSTSEELCGDLSTTTCTEDGITGTSANYLSRTETELIKVGLLGITVIAASGDDGANGAQNADCNYASSAPTYLFAQYPATSPHVTAVGGTQLGTNTDSPSTSSSESGVPWCGLGPGNNNVPSGYTWSSEFFGRNWAFACITGGTENAADSFSGFYSGGGFSRNFALPSWQSSVVNSYLHSGVSLPNRTFYNPSMRAIPDVSIFGSFYPILINSEIETVVGTSLAAPLFAAVVVYMNEISIQYTGKSLGWINPLLYGMSANASNTFRDITSGNNIPTRSTSSGCQGFTARAGWVSLPIDIHRCITTSIDAVTGYSSSSSSTRSTSSSLSTSMSWMTSTNNTSIYYSTGFINGSYSNLSQSNSIIAIIVASIIVMLLS